MKPSRLSIFPWLLAIATAFLLPTSLVQAVDADAPDLNLIKATSLKLAADLVPQPKKSGDSIKKPDGIGIQYGKLFDESMLALVNFFPRPINDGEFDYPPCYLSLLEWSDGAWRFRQYLGSASGYEIHERRDLKIKVLQGWCRTERHGGEQISWKWDAKSGKLVPTNLDKWGPYSIIGDFIVYQRGRERLAHWETHWIYRFKDGKRGALVACYHWSDMERWTVSFLASPGDKELTSWAFWPSPEHPDQVIVKATKDMTDIDGSEIAELRVVSGDGLIREYCFTLLTGLNAKLLEHEWLEKVPAVNEVHREKIDAIGDESVVQRFQWPKRK